MNKQQIQAPAHVIPFIEKNYVLNRNRVCRDRVQQLPHLFQCYTSQLEAVKYIFIIAEIPFLLILHYIAKRVF